MRRAVGQIGHVGDPATVLVGPEEVDVVAVVHGYLVLQAQAVAFDEIGQLSKLVELGLAVLSALEVEALRQLRVEQDVVAPLHALESKTESLGQAQGILEADAAAACQDGLPSLPGLHHPPG